MPELFALAFGLIFFMVVMVGYKSVFKRSQTLVDNLDNVSSLPSVGVWQARYMDEPYNGVLRVDAQNLKFDNGVTKFQLAVKDIQKVIYNRHSLQINATKASYTLRALRDSPQEAGALYNHATYGQVAHSPDTLKNFLAAMQNLNITIEKGSITPSAAYYQSIVAGFLP